MGTNSKRRHGGGGGGASAGKNGKGGGGKGKPGGKPRRNRETKLVLTFDEDERKDYLTGFHKRRLERQAKAAEELKRKERRERIKLRAEYRKEIARMVEQRGMQLEAAGLAASRDLVATDEKEQEFDSKDQLVTVTTVSYGFGDEGGEDADGDGDAGGAGPAADPGTTSSELLRRAQRAQSSIAALKKAAFRAVSAAAPPSRQPKPKRSRKQRGAVPKRAKGKGAGKSAAAVEISKKSGRKKKGGRK